MPCVTDGGTGPSRAGPPRRRDWPVGPGRVKSNLWPSGSSSLGRARPCQGRGSGFEARLPLQYQTREKRPPCLTRNGYYADRVIWQRLGLELLEDASDKTRPLAAIGGLPSGHQVHQLCFAPLQIDVLWLRGGLRQLALLI